MIGKLAEVLGPQAAARLRRTVGLAVATAVLEGVAFALLVPVLRALLGDRPTGVWPWLAGLVVVACGYAVLRYVAVAAGYRLGAGLARGLYQRLGDHVAQLPLGWFGADRVGALSRLTTKGVVDVMTGPAHLLVPLVGAVVTPATVVLAMFVFDWRIALAALATAPVLLVVYRWSGRLITEAERINDAATAEAAGRVVEFAQAQPVLRAFGRDGAGHRELDDALAAQRRAYRAMIIRGVPGITGFGIVVQAAFTAVLMVGVGLALGGSLAVPELLAMLVLAVRFVEPMSAAAEHAGRLTLCRNALDRMAELLRTPPMPEPRHPRHSGGTDIEFDQVSFSYDTGDLVLHDVSFRAPAGRVTALVGPSGAGKTTVFRLITRFFDTTAGAVRIGGVDVRELSTEELMAKLALVFQDVYLFEGTIADNIRVGRPDATDEQVHEAARLARVTEIVDRLPDGWDTRVGEGGATLSGGERQRVSIARAILKDAPIVLLDEATSALDMESQAAVLDALGALAAGRTLLVIAHRLPTITTADHIVLLDQGRVAERGNHDELMAAAGRYAEFWGELDRARGWRLTAAPATVH
jgi:ATP-binding cassette, subfamily B, bacterial IrtB/YbtQ